MLYDNAQLAKLYLKAHRLWPDQGYAAIAMRTLDFVEDELKHRQGAYMSSLSAVDRNNKEGGFYLWTKAQLENLLSPDEMDYLAQQGLTQLRLAETEKYAHVTFFFSGGREELFPGEQRELVPSESHLEPMVWYDEEDRSTALHFDNFENVMIVLSGTKVCEMLNAGEKLPDEFTRREVAAILEKFYAPK